MVHGGHTLGISLRGCILECTHMRGLVPSLITSHGQDLHLRNRMAMALGDLTQGMAHSHHILLGNYEIIQTDRAMPIIRSYPV